MRKSGTRFSPQASLSSTASIYQRLEDTASSATPRDAGRLSRRGRSEAPAAGTHKGIAAAMQTGALDGLCGGDDGARAAGDFSGK